MTNQLIFKSACWTCYQAQEDPTEQFICPQINQHWQDYNQYTNQIK